MKQILTVLLALTPLQPALAATAKSDIFIIGADNSDEAIQHLTAINNLTIQDIEDRARPCAYSHWQGCSGDGFLGRDESFIQRLLIDNAYVHTQGLTHARLAEPLTIMATLPASHCTLNDPEWPLLGGTCVWHDVDYTVEFHPYFGYQESIFDDEFRTNTDVVVTNHTTGQVIIYSKMLTAYIHEYGFYEGNTPYRLSPEAIVNMFNLK